MNTTTHILKSKSQHGIRAGDLSFSQSCLCCSPAANGRRRLSESSLSNTHV